jgi:hypothetical protein
VTSPCHEWGRWHLEAGIGKCAAPYAPVLKTPEKAGAWVEKSGTLEAGWCFASRTGPASHLGHRTAHGRALVNSMRTAKPEHANRTRCGTCSVADDPDHHRWDGPKCHRFVSLDQARQSGGDSLSKLDDETALKVEAFTAVLNLHSLAARRIL